MIRSVELRIPKPQHARYLLEKRSLFGIKSFINLGRNMNDYKSAFRVKIGCEKFVFKVSWGHLYP